MAAPDIAPPASASAALRSLRTRAAAFSPWQLGITYLLLHLLLGGFRRLVVTPGSVEAEVVLPAWLALVALIALFRDEDAVEAGVLMAVIAAGTMIFSVLLRTLTSDLSQPEQSSLLFSFFALPMTIGAASGVNAAVVVGLVRFAQRQRKVLLPDEAQTVLSVVAFCFAVGGALMTLAVVVGLAARVNGWLPQGLGEDPTLIALLNLGVGLGCLWTAWLLDQGDRLGAYLGAGFLLLSVLPALVSGAPWEWTTVGIPLAGVIAIGLSWPHLSARHGVS